MKQVLHEKAERARFRATLHRWSEKGTCEAVQREATFYDTDHLSGGQTRLKDGNESTILSGARKALLVGRLRALEGCADARNSRTAFEFDDAIAFAEAKAPLTGFEAYAAISCSLAILP